MALISAAKAAQVLGKSPARIYELARLGILPSVHIGRSISFDEDTLRQWIASGGKALRGGWKREPSEQ
jgi:predicted DNA-binding transcriptional regulator AlpA